MESKVRDDADKVAVQVKSYGWILGDNSDRLKGRAAEPFNGTSRRSDFHRSEILSQAVQYLEMVGWCQVVELH